MAFPPFGRVRARPDSPPRPVPFLCAVATGRQVRTGTGSGTVTGSDGNGQRFATMPPTVTGDRRTRSDGHAPTGSERSRVRRGDLPTGSGTVKATGQPPTATGNRPRPICRQVTGRQVRNGHGFGRATVPTGQQSRRQSADGFAPVPICRRALCRPTGQPPTGSERSRPPTVTPTGDNRPAPDLPTVPADGQGDGATAPTGSATVPPFG